FQPVTAHLPASFLQFRVANWGSATTDIATAHARLSRTLGVISALHAAGIPIVAGTDEGVPGFSVYRELELYVYAGFTPMDALRSATAVAAAAMRLERDVGTLEAGKRADLLVLDANPLDNISNIRRVHRVMANGVLFDPAGLWRAAGFIP
ncbi:MAG: amidohydrolase family protein, partial [Solirubrobacteraceae bacterium]